MEEPQAAFLDWPKLPADLLTIILGELEFPDLFSAAAVCTAWRDTARALRRLGMYGRPQTPCLLYTSAAAGIRAAELFSLADRKTYRARVPDPPMGERTIVGSSHGWLVTADGRSELHLLNPVTGEQIALPSVATVEQVTPVFDSAGSLQRYDLSFYITAGTEYQPAQPYALDELRGVLYRKVVLSCDPSQGNCIVVMIHEPYNQLSFARLGDTKWHWITASLRDYSDCIFHAGAFYAMNLLGGIHRYTIGASCATRDIIFKDTSPFIAHNLYICQNSSGDWLQIWRYTTNLGDYTEEEIHTTCIFVYKVDFDKQDIVEAHTLGDDALFIGHSHTCCFSTKDYPGLLPNHVYFTDDDEYCSEADSKASRRDVGVYSLEAKYVSDVVSPQQWLNWPTPVWITPSFNRIKKLVV